jgi:DNA-binding transcriptional LysR family regulator
MVRPPSSSRRLVPPLSALVAFEAAARHGSFTRAADELALTQSAVSRRVNLLEEMLGIELFTRVRNTVTLTSVGEFYARRIQEQLSGLALATQEATLFHGRGGLLRLGMPPTFGARWLIPRIGEFLRVHRDINIAFCTCLPGNADFARDELDAVIDCGPVNAADLCSDKLLDERLVVAAHPDIAAQGLTPEKLKSMTLLSQALQPWGWSEWFAMQGAEMHPDQTVLSFSLFSMVIEAAIGKLGIALLPELHIENEIEKGQLVLPFPGAAVHTTDVSLAYPIARRTYPPLQIFRKWLLDECQKTAQMKQAPKRPRLRTVGGADGAPSQAAASGRL